MIRLNESSRALLAIASTFVVGIVVGCGADRALFNAPSYAAARSAQREAARHHDEVLAELRAELRLTAAQDAQVREIFAARQTEMDAAWKQVHASVAHAMRQTTAQIEAVLDPAQAERFRAWIAERHGSNRASHPRGTEH
jgi:hypothetical protein